MQGAGGKGSGQAQREQAAFRGCWFIHPLWSRDSRLWVFLSLPVLLLLQGGVTWGLVEFGDISS